MLTTSVTNYTHIPYTPAPQKGSRKSESFCVGLKNVLADLILIKAMRLSAVLVIPLYDNGKFEADRDSASVRS